MSRIGARPGCRPRRFLATACCLAMGLWVGVAEAQETSTQVKRTQQDQAQSTAGADQPPTLGARKVTTRKAGKGTSLADLAGSIKLDRGAAGGGFVVTNQNLAEVAGRGVISVGSGDSEGQPEQPAAASAEAGGIQVAKTPEQVWRDELAAQQKKIEQMQQDRADFEKKVTEGRGPYDSSGPHNLAPDVVSANQQTREQADARIEAERQRLQQLQSQGRRQGYNPESPPQ